MHNFSIYVNSMLNYTGGHLKRSEECNMLLKRFLGRAPGCSPGPGSAAPVAGGIWEGWLFQPTCEMLIATKPSKHKQVATCYKGTNKELWKIGNIAYLESGTMNKWTTCWLLACCGLWLAVVCSWPAAQKAQSCCPAILQCLCLCFCCRLQQQAEQRRSRWALASCGWQSGCALTVCRHPTSPALPDSWRPSSMCTRHVSSRPRRRPRYWALVWPRRHSIWPAIGVIWQPTLLDLVLGFDF